MSTRVSPPAAPRDPAALLTAGPTPLGPTTWRTVTGAEVAAFAAATGLPARIEVAGTVAVHGAYALALAGSMLAELLEVDGYAVAVDYGLDRVRFPAPFPVGSRVRAHGLLLSAQVHPPAIRTVTELRYECDAAGPPVCVAQVVTLLLPVGAGPTAR